MRFATLYDVHGNLAALEAVLQEIPDDAVIVVGGDVCVGGADPSETLERLRSLGERVRWLRGNGDRELTPGEVGLGPAADMDATRQALSAEQIEFLYGLQPNVQIGRLYFCHATPRNDLDIFIERTPEPWVAGLFATWTPTSSSAVTPTRNSNARSAGSALSIPAASADPTRTPQARTGRSTSSTATPTTPISNRLGLGARKHSRSSSTDPFAPDTSASGDFRTLPQASVVVRLRLVLLVERADGVDVHLNPDTGVEWLEQLDRLLAIHELRQL